MIINPNKVYFWVCLLIVMVAMTLSWFAIQAGHKAVGQANKAYEKIETIYKEGVNYENDNRIDSDSDDDCNSGDCR